MPDSHLQSSERSARVLLPPQNTAGLRVKTHHIRYVNLRAGKFRGRLPHVCTTSKDGCHKILVIYARSTRGLEMKIFQIIKQENGFVKFVQKINLQAVKTKTK